MVIFRRRACANTPLKGYHSIKIYALRGNSHGQITGCKKGRQKKAAEINKREKAGKAGEEKE